MRAALVVHGLDAVDVGTARRTNILFAFGAKPGTPESMR
jgi:hypothetical protein